MGNIISTTGLSPSLVRLSSRFIYDIALISGALWCSDVRSTTQYTRQPKLITMIRGQTCVQLGIMDPRILFRLVRFRSPLLTESS